MLKKLSCEKSSKKIIVFSIFYSLLMTTSCVVSVTDNRFRDTALSHYPFLTNDGCSTIFTFQPFLETANNAFDEYGKRAPLFDIGQPYRLRVLEQSLLATGRIDDRLIPTNFQGILTEGGGGYDMEGRLEIQGLGFHLYAPIWEHFAVGLSGELVHVSSRMELVRDRAFTEVSDQGGDGREVILLREALHKALDIEPAKWSAFMVGDCEVYGRLFTSFDHRYKCRFIDVGASVGLILPAARRRDINNPASIPLGGDRHWGIFFEGDLHAELKQNLHAGFWFRLINRFSQQACHRVPFGKEPRVFGAIVGDIEVHPGLTGAFSPYILFEEIRGGLGIYGAYTLVKHQADSFIDRRKDRSVPINMTSLICNSRWGLEHVSVAFLYDFSYGKRERCLDPVLTFKIDVPVDFLVSERSSKTYGVSFILETSF